MTIAAVGAVQGVTGTGYIPDVSSVTPSTGDGFAASLTGAIDNAQALQGTAKTLAVQAVTGNLDDVHKAAIASTEAQVTLELVSAVRNKGVDAFNEIMRMQA